MKNPYTCWCEWLEGLSTFGDPVQKSQRQTEDIKHHAFLEGRISGMAELKVWENDDCDAEGHKGKTARRWRCPGCQDALRYWLNLSPAFTYLEERQ